MFNPLRYYALHEHLANEHGLVLLESQLEEIILICKKLESEVSKKITVPVEIDVPDGCEFEGIRKERTFYKNELALIPIFKPIPPAKKVIDLSCIVGSGIDCEFSADRDYWFVGVLKNAAAIDYCAGDGGNWKYCRMRQSPHVHFWGGGDKCPLPKGLEIKLYLRDGDISTTNDYLYLRWDYVGSLGDIIAFEILGTAPGWRYEWEEE